MSESPHGTDDPREIVEDLETRTRHEATPEDPDTAEGTAEKKDGPDLADGDDGERSDLAPEVPGSPEPPD